MKFKTLFAVLILLIFVSGCSLVQKKTKDFEPEKIEYRTGTTALKMSFLENFPKDEIKNGTKFQAMVEVENQGAYDINNIELSLTGIRQQYTKVIGDSKKTVEKLPGKSINFPEGSKEIVSFQLENFKRLPKDKHTELIRINACYPYQTVASAQICINPTMEVAGLSQAQSVCKADQSISLSGGQGAPIAVTRIEQTTTPTDFDKGIYELELKIHISNLGKGEVFEESGCNGVKNVKIADINFHTFRLGSGIVCNNQIELESKDNILTCTAEINSQMGAFPTPFTIELSYWYEDKVEKTIEVLKPKED